MALVIDLSGPTPTSYDEAGCDVCRSAGPVYRLVRTTEVLCARCFQAVHSHA